MKLTPLPLTVWAISTVGWPLVAAASAMIKGGREVWSELLSRLESVPVDALTASDIMSRDVTVLKPDAKKPVGFENMNMAVQPLEETRIKGLIEFKKREDFRLWPSILAGGVISLLASVAMLFSIYVLPWKVLE